MVELSKLQRAVHRHKSSYSSRFAPFQLPFL
jgi:hypothetical protein